MPTVLLARNTKFGQYKLTGHIGSGGFSDVYKAEGPNGRTVAIKVLRVAGSDLSDIKERFVKERDVLSVVSSRNVAKLVDADLDHDQPWIASEYINGETLKDYVERIGSLSLSEIRSITASLLATLTELHGIGVVHRDLTPANIVLGNDGPTLVDFGASRYDLEHLATGTLVSYGTPGYVSPEATEEKTVGAAADIFALGRVIEFMFTGDTPSGSSKVPDEDLQSLINEASHRDPKDRPSSADLAKGLNWASNANVWASLFTEQEVRKLPRRIRSRTVISLMLFTAFGVFLISYLLLKVEEETVTVQSVLDNVVETQQIDFSVNRVPKGVFSEVPFPDDFEGGRVEPQNLVHYNWVRGKANGNTTYKYFDAYRFLKCYSDNCNEEGTFRSFEILVELQASRIQFEMEELFPVEKYDSLDIPPALGFLFDSYVESYPDLACGFIAADQMLALNPSRFLLIASQNELQSDCKNSAVLAIIYDQQSGTVTSLSFINIEPTLDLFESFEFSGEPVIKPPDRTEIRLKEFAGFQSGATACTAILYIGSCDQYDKESFRTYVLLEPSSGFSIRATEDIGPLYFDGILNVGATGFVPFAFDDTEELEEDFEGVPFWDTANFFPALATFPFGRWNIDEPGEHYFFNPFPESSVIVLLEVTGIKLIGDKPNPIDYLVIREQTSKDLDTYSDGRIWDTFSQTTAALGEEWEPYLSSSGFSFPSSNSISGFFAMQFYYPNIYAEVISMDDVKIPFISSEFPIIYGTDEQTTALKTTSNFDYTLSRPDDPGLYLVLARHFQAGLGRYSPLGGLDGTLEDCFEILKWLRPLKLGSIEVFALTNCDIIPAGSGGGTPGGVRDTQAPIYEFIFKDQDNFPIIYGRFTPGGYFDYFNFRDLLNELVINEEAILSAKELANPCSGMTVEEELEILSRTDEWFGNTWLENLPCSR